jgi:hypothetical protein
MPHKIDVIPPAARALGFLGLVPFFAAAAASLTPAVPLHDVASQALIAYGAVILSFLGGVRWGLAIAAPDGARLFAPLDVSVVPSLAAWIALLLPRQPGLVVLAAGLAALLAADLRLRSAPDWYRALRVPLSAGAIVSLLLGLAA